MTDYDALIRNLEASLRFDAINGDAHERAVVASQVRQAAAAIRDMRAERDALAKDAERLNFLEAQRKWGDCFAIQHLDSGDVYVRPWRYALQSMELLAAPIVAQTLRETIDAALAAQEKPAGLKFKMEHLTAAAAECPDRETVVIQDTVS